MTEYTAAKIVQLLCLLDLIESVKSPPVVQKLNENWRLLKYLIGNIQELQCFISYFFFYLTDVLFAGLTTFWIGTGIRNRVNVAPKVCRNASNTDHMMAFLGDNCYESTQMFSVSRYHVSKLDCKW